MGTVPTGHMERELRKLYLQWLAGVPRHEADLPAYINMFQAKSTSLISRLGGQAASLGALADFPVPKLLELSPVAGVVYDQMKQAAIQAGIAAGLNSRDIARQILNAGLDKSYRRLERLARTETVSAYWKNQWDSTADLPLIVMVWGSEQGKRTCDYCISRDGLVVEDPNIRDHPNGRCTLIPTLRSRVNYKGTLQPDGSVTMDPAWTGKQAKTKTVAAGPTTEAQRDPMSGKSNPAAPSQAQAAQASAPRPAPAPQPTPQVKTFGADVDAKTRKARISEGDWRYIDDRQKRSVTLLQNDFRAEQAVKKMATNIRNGADPRSGVAVPRSWSKDYTGHVTDVGVKYTEAQVKDALEDAARWLIEQEAVKTRVLYKGLDVPVSKIKSLFQEGGVFDVNYSSFSTDEVVARKYSSMRRNQQVVVRVKGAEGISVKGNPTADHWVKTKEHLVTGQGRITKVTDDGRTVYVDVEFG